MKNPLLKQFEKAKGIIAPRNKIILPNHLKRKVEPPEPVKTVAETIIPKEFHFKEKGIFLFPIPADCIKLENITINDTPIDYWDTFWWLAFNEDQAKVGDTLKVYYRKGISTIPGESIKRAIKMKKEMEKKDGFDEGSKSV